MKRCYKYLIFDVDDTLLDFHVAYTNAQRSVAEKLGINYSEEYQILSEECGWRAWKESGLDHTECLDVQKKYHVRYEQYLKSHYGYLTEMLGITADSEDMAEWHLNGLASTKVPMESDMYCLLESKMTLNHLSNLFRSQCGVINFQIVFKG